MSHPQENVPPTAGGTSASIELVVLAKTRDLGGFAVRRSLPTMQRRHVGPFVFVDHMGPVTFQPGHGIDVRPHPHIALATITYLFEGEILHRDSLGSRAPIRPGDVNWMVAGRGIVHSERTSPEVRANGQRLHGLQTWVALPKEFEEIEPKFEHHESHTLPKLQFPGVDGRIVAGTAYGQRSPVAVLSPMLYVHANIAKDAALAIDDEHAERAAYVVDGSVECDGRVFAEGALVLFRPGMKASVRANTNSSVMLLGGAPLDGERHLYWNFVSSSLDRIEQAKRDWQARRFPAVPGDETEFIPLPD